MAQFPIMKTLARIAVTRVDGEYRIRIEDQSGDTAVYRASPIRWWILLTCSTISFLTKTRSRPLDKAL